MENNNTLIKMFEVFPDHFNHLFPMIFQCSDCQTILGDSLSWEIANEAMQVVCLSQASESVVADEEILIQRSGNNQISTYSKLYCKGCRQTIGKFFHSTCHDFDQFRGLFSFHVSQVSIYQTGREANYKDILSRPEYTDPIKCVLISLNERLSQIEKKLGILRGFETADGDNNIGGSSGGGGGGGGADDEVDGGGDDDEGDGDGDGGGGDEDDGGGGKDENRDTQDTSSSKHSTSVNSSTSSSTSSRNSSSSQWVPTNSSDGEISDS